MEKKYRPGADLKLAWSDYKSDNGSLCVYFAGGFQLYVLPFPRLRKDGPTKHWRVTWHIDHAEVSPNEMRGLTDRAFSTRIAAQLAAEAIFAPVAKVAVHMVGFVADIQRSLGCWNPRARKLRKGVRKPRRNR